MSRYTQQLNDKTIIELGYDKPMDYVFVQVIKDGEYLYSNINDPEISFTLETDFRHFDVEVRKLGFEIPESLKVKTLEDRADYLETLEKEENQILAFYNDDLIGDGDGRDYGVEIYRDIDGLHNDVIDYEFFATESEALARANQINGAFIDDEDDL
ncbi:hypothetical protein ACOTWR_11675 [Aliarcobacter butzleri]|uniref:hypothetical protein n=1 Tax=Aliarcobacter butzleri TaxID=28197 RepID=UPI0021B42F2B|nr:hypothetical protein [Aliarcobacter butzleri]MCT7563339.1 hypothetical protein [Aliarcobacter butzleri]MCT7580225.1 hypothetical protein [Aliarcobacter butzleri]